MSDTRIDELLARTSRTFALTIPLLPEPTRAEVAVSYLLFRIADTFEDAWRWPRRARVGFLGEFGRLVRAPSAGAARELSRRALAVPPTEHAGYLELLADIPLVLAALGRLSPRARRIVAEHTARTAALMAHWAGRADEAGRLELADMGELRRYCYAVAGIVGEMLTELFLLGRAGLGRVAGALRRRAVEFGEGLQLVNILRDASADDAEGRRFLPARVDRPRVFALARRDLARAAEYVRLLQGAGAERGLVAFTALPVLLARATLDLVERDGPGAKLPRPEVARIVAAMDAALDAGADLVPA